MGESVSKSHPDLMKDLKRVYGKLTLQQKLVSAENMRRMKLGRAIAHKIGGEVPCTPVLSAVRGGAGSLTGEVAGYKAPALRGGALTPPTTLLPSAHSQSTKRPKKSNMAGRDASTIISGNGSNVPGIQEESPMTGRQTLLPASSKASTPSTSSGAPVEPNTSLNLCGMELSNEVCLAVSLICDFDKLETALFDRAENEHQDEEVFGGIMDVHEVVQGGKPTCALSPSALAEYLGLVRMTLLSAKEILPRDSLSVKLRCAGREGGKVEKGLIEAERLARAAAVTEVTPVSASKRSLGEDEKDFTAANVPKIMRRSSSPSPAASEGSSLDTTEEFPTWNLEGDEVRLEEGASKEESVEEVGSKEEGEDGDDDGEEEEPFNKQEYHDRMDSHTRGMKAASINFEELESDSEEEKKMTHAERRWAMMYAGERDGDVSAVEGYKSFVLGPTTPDTLNYLVVGCTPLDDKSVAKAIKDQASFSAAAAKGKRKSKALANFTRGSLQSTFAPGSYAFSSAIRHERKENEKTNPWDASKTVPFKSVFATSDRQFRHIVWANLMGRKCL